MSLLWARRRGEPRSSPDERRVRDHLDSLGGVSESVASLSTKLGLDRGRCRRVLERLVKEGMVQRRDFPDIEPIYYRYPNRSS